MSKSLIVYFSRKGQNYAGGKIVNLAVGNTEIAAQKIQALTGGDLFEIRTVHTYAENYRQCTEEAQAELRSNARPELAGKLPELEAYDKIYLGYPNWWGTMPMAVFTFLEQAQVQGKRILPFCTHEGSGLGHSVRDIQKLCPEAQVEQGLAVRGSSVAAADKEIAAWVAGHE